MSENGSGEAVTVNSPLRRQFPQPRRDFFMVLVRAGAVAVKKQRQISLALLRHFGADAGEIFIR